MFSRIASRVVRRAGVRNMGHDAHAEVERTGWDKALRSVLKQDHELVIGVITLYGTLGFIAAKWPRAKKAAPAIEAPVVSSSDSEIPSVDSPAFEAWVNVEGNVEKFFAKL